MEIHDEEIFTVISHCLKLPKESVTPHLRYHEIPSWDSLGHIYLITELERHFNIKIPHETIYVLNNVHLICSYIKNRTIAVSPPRNGNAGVSRGLKDIYFDETRISMIDPEGSRISYREYDLLYLMEHYSYEEAVFLMIFEHLPSKAELSNFLEQLFDLKEECFEYYSAQYSGREPAEQHLAILDFIFYLNNIQDKTRLLPYKIYGAALLFLCLVNGYKYQSNFTIDHLLENTFALKNRDAQLLKQCMVLLMEHGANAGAFSLRVAASTGNNFILSLCAAIITFSGNKHGGALLEVNDFVRMLINNPNKEWFIEMCIKNNVNIPGFGHRVYKKEDPRVLYIAGLIAKMLEDESEKGYYTTCLEILSILEKYKRYGLIPNVDFFSGILFNMLRLPPAAFLSIFIVSRMPGLIAHFNEQHENNILIRPNLKYNGKSIISE